MVMLLIVPLSEMPPLVDQLVVVKSEFCCNVQPVEGDGQETVTLVPEWVIVATARRAFAPRKSAPKTLR